MKKRLTNWVFILTSCIMVVSAFTDCTLLTKGVIKSAKGDNKIKIVSVDSAFVTDKNEIIVYTTQQFKSKKPKQEIAVFNYLKEANSRGYTNSDYVTFFSGRYLKNDVYKTEYTGEIVNRFRIINSSDTTILKNDSIGKPDMSGIPLMLLKGSEPYTSVRMELTLDWGDEKKELVVYHLSPKSKIRRPQMYLTIPLAVAGDIVLTGVLVGAAVVAVPVLLITGSNHKKAINPEEDIQDTQETE